MFTCSAVVDWVEKVFELKYDLEGVGECFIRFKYIRVEKICLIGKIIIEVNKILCENNGGDYRGNKG